MPSPMRVSIRVATAVASTVLLATALAPTAASRDQAPSRVSAPAARAQDLPPAKCCFTNPRYAGTCEVEPAKDESCAAILGYLNNPLSQGKSYCGNTPIRGGWQSASCERKE